MGHNPVSRLSLSFRLSLAAETVVRRTLSTLLWTLALSVGVAAHVPHDVMNEVALSPDFAQDQTVFGAFVFIDQQHFGRSTDGGRNWEMRQLPMAQHGIVAFAFSPGYAVDGTAFCATGWGVYRSIDRGLSWTAINTGLTQLITTDIAVSPQFATDDTLLLATRTGAFRSVDGGDNWLASELGLSESMLNFVTVTVGGAGSVVAYIGGDRVHRSENLGQSWLGLHDFGLPIAALSASPNFAGDDTLAVALESAGVQVSNNSGATFAPSSNGLTDLATTDIAFTASGELLLTSDLGVWRAAGPFQNWTPQVLGLQALDPLGSPHFRSLAPSPDFANDGTVLLAAFEGCSRSVDGGLSWLSQNSFQQQLLPNLVVSPTFTHDRLVLAASPGAGLLAWQVPLLPPPSGPRGRKPSAATMGAGLLKPAPPPQPIGPGTTPVPPTGTVIETRSTDLGSLWNEGLALSPDFANDGTLFFAYVGAFRSTDGGAGWTGLSLPPGVIILRDIALSPDFANDNTVFVGTNGSGFFRSPDRGDSWTNADTGLPSDFKTRVIRISPGYADDQTLFAASWNYGLWKSTSAGAAWQSVSGAIPGINMQALALSPDYGNDATVLVGEKPGRLWRSVDGGGSWQMADLGLPAADAMVITDIAFSPDFAADRMVATATGDGAIWLSSDGADSWQLVTRYDTGTVRSLVFSPNVSRDGLLFAAAPPQLLALRPLGMSANDPPAARAPVLIRGEGDDFSVSESGGWSAVATAGAFGATTTRTTTPGAWREWEFFGRSIRCYGEQGPDAPLVDITLDGLPVATADLYAPDLAQQLLFFEQEFGSSGWHTVRITHSGLANPLSTGNSLAGDGFATTR